MKKADCESESLFAAKQKKRSNLKSLLIPHEKPNLLREWALYSLFFLFFHFFLFPERQEQNNMALVHSPLLFAGKQIHIKIIRD